jgi:hypothetical protein
MLALQGTKYFRRQAAVLAVILAAMVSGYFVGAALAVEPGSVVVSRESLESAEPQDIVASNATFVDALFSENLHNDEIPREAVISYYAELYRAEVENGGFSHFIRASKWAPAMIGMVREGLAAIKAGNHLKLFDESAAIVGRMGPDRLKAFIANKDFGSNEERDALDEHNTRFYEISQGENLTALNAAYLRAAPGLRAMTSDEMRAEVERRAAALPDREARDRAALEHEPRSMKLMRALALKAGHTFGFPAAGGMEDYNGKKVKAWHFITSKGHQYMIDEGGKAVMFDAGTGNAVVEVAAP